MTTSPVYQPAELSGYRAFFSHLSGLCTYTAPAPVPLMHETVFQQLLLDVMGTDRPVEFRRFRRLLFQAMVHFRRMKEGDLANGFADLQLLRANFPPLSVDIRLLGEAMLTPMIAYYYFRIGDYPTAGYYNQQSVAISSELQHTYPVLHLHQIQQQFNLSRIDLARHRYDDALHIIKELIDYLIIGRFPKLTGTWTAALRAGLMPSLISNQLLEILNELVFMALKLTELEPTITDTVLTESGQSLSERALPVPSPESAILTWWQSYRHETDGQQGLFLADISRLIEQYPAPYDHLKLLLLGRLHFAAAHSDSASPEHLLLIRRFVNTKLQLSHRLQQYIRTLRSQRLVL